MAQSDNHPDPETRKGLQHRQELATNYSTEPSGQNAGKAPAAQNTDTHPFPPCSTWLSAETLDDHRRHCCQLLKKKAGSPNSTRHARSDSCIRQCGPSTNARLCLQHTGNNPSQAQKLHAEQRSQSTFSAPRI